MELSQEVENFKSTVKDLTIDEFDYEKIMDGLSKPQMSLWNEYVRNKTLFQMEWELMHKRGMIQMHPDFIDQNMVAEYEPHRLDQASRF